MGIIDLMLLHGSACKGSALMIVKSGLLAGTSMVCCSFVY